MAKYARLQFNTMDYAYLDRYGVMPDYDYTNMVRDGIPADQAARIRQNRLDALWREMKREHEQRQRLKPFEPLTGDDRCPF